MLSGWTTASKTTLYQVRIVAFFPMSTRTKLDVADSRTTPDGPCPCNDRFQETIRRPTRTGDEGLLAGCRRKQGSVRQCIRAFWLRALIAEKNAAFGRGAFIQDFAASASRFIGLPEDVPESGFVLA